MRTASIYTALGFALAPGLALAHPHIESGPAAASKTQTIKIGVSHGCSGADTLRLRVEIPAGVTGIRVLRSDFGKPILEKDANNVVTAISWQKPDGEVLDSDYGYPELEFRARIPDVPFTSLQFNADQTCRTAAGAEMTVRWDQPAGGSGNTAPTLTVVPAHVAGWNKLVIPAGRAVSANDLPKYFGDAQIVWKGTEAYSANANTLTLIMGTPGVSLLSGLQAGDEIWVRY
jgi:periplasmic copper chaperone A